ncbi:hypothetical protein BB561_007017, partial [Smittium simulii]
MLASPNSMLVLSGESALSEFRANSLLSKIQILVPKITSLKAVYVHFVNLNFSCLSQDIIKQLDLNL